MDKPKSGVRSVYANLALWEEARLVLKERGYSMSSAVDKFLRCILDGDLRRIEGVVIQDAEASSFEGAREA